MDGLPGSARCRRDVIGHCAQIRRRLVVATVHRLICIKALNRQPYSCRRSVRRSLSAMHSSTTTKQGRELTRPMPALIVVDDDAAVRNSLKFVFEMDGFSVRLYASASELLNETDLPTYGCLLIDYYLPDLNGLDLLTRLRNHGVVLPALLVTGHPSLTLRRRVKQAGVCLVEKPLLGDRLAEMVRESLEQCPLTSPER
jgi:CheY-like chemotaxis protein